MGRKRVNLYLVKSSAKSVSKQLQFFKLDRFAQIKFAFRRHFKLAKRGEKQRTIPSCIKFSLSELKKASIRLQNNKFPLKKHKA